MRYAQIRRYDVANGEGIRTSVFVTGCTHRCPNCFNAEYQDFACGMLWDAAATETLIGYLRDPNVSGLTLLGGEPMQNLELIDVVRSVRRSVAKSIWIYSGYTWEQILEHPDRRALLEECDVLVDGLFVQALYDARLAFRGSSNQRIIDIRRSMAEGRVVLYDVRR